MADQKEIEKEKQLSASKRSYKEISSPNHLDDLSQSSSNPNHDDSPNSSVKKIKAFSYRDHSAESFDAETRKTSLEYPGLSDSHDSEKWNLSNWGLASSTSKSGSFGSLEFSSIIQLNSLTSPVSENAPLNSLTSPVSEKATLNSLSMAEMSSFSAVATSHSFPGTVEMASPVSSQSSIPGFELNIPVRNDATNVNVMAFCENAMSSPIRMMGDKAPLEAPDLGQSSCTSTNGRSFEGKLSTISPNRQTSHASSPNSAADVGESSNPSSVQISWIDSHVKPENDPSSASSNVIKATVNSLRHTKPNMNNSICEDNLKINKAVTDKGGVDVRRDCDGRKEKKIEPYSPNEDETQNNPSQSDKSINDSGIDLAYESNSELKENFKTCKKNPGHEDFYCPQDLKVTDLPEDIQHEDSVTFFQCLSKLVVQISVKHTSNQRSEEDVYSSYKGTNQTRHGSGFIASTDKDIRKMKCMQKDCPHNEAADESPPGTATISPHNKSFNRMNSTNSTNSVNSSGFKRHFTYSGVYVRTNRHVIFDKSEADNADVRFFFHSSDRKEIVEGYVASILGVNNDQDNILLHVMSHDRQLSNKMDLHLDNAKSSFHQMIRSTHNTQQFHGRNKLSWVAVISHPHGTPNSISFGRLMKEEAETKRVIKYYDAATCPGSSGGLVITPTLLHLQWPGAVHSSFCQRTKFNVSLDSRFPELDLSMIGQRNKSIISFLSQSP